jgi:hypothetical protein
MRLPLIRLDKRANYDERTFKCHKCGHLETRLVIFHQAP